jgi:hypothetical protein
MPHNRATSMHIFYAVDFNLRLVLDPGNLRLELHNLLLEASMLIGSLEQTLQSTQLSRRQL